MSKQDDRETTELVHIGIQELKKEGLWLDTPEIETAKLRSLSFLIRSKVLPIAIGSALVNRKITEGEALPLFLDQFKHWDHDEKAKFADEVLESFALRLGTYLDPSSVTEFKKNAAILHVSFSHLQKVTEAWKDVRADRFYALKMAVIHHLETMSWRAKRRVRTAIARHAGSVAFFFNVRPKLDRVIKQIDKHEWFADMAELRKQGKNLATEFYAIRDFDAIKIAPSNISVILRDLSNEPALLELQERARTISHRNDLRSNLSAKKNALARTIDNIKNSAHSKIGTLRRHANELRTAYDQSLLLREFLVKEDPAPQVRALLFDAYLDQALLLFLGQETNSPNAARIDPSTFSISREWLLGFVAETKQKTADNFVTWIGEQFKTLSWNHSRQLNETSAKTLFRLIAYLSTAKGLASDQIRGVKLALTGFISRTIDTPYGQNTIANALRDIVHSDWSVYDMPTYGELIVRLAHKRRSIDALEKEMRARLLDRIKELEADVVKAEAERDLQIKQQYDAIDALERELLEIDNTSQ